MSKRNYPFERHFNRQTQNRLMKARKKHELQAKLGPVTVYQDMSVKTTIDPMAVNYRKSIEPRKPLHLGNREVLTVIRDKLTLKDKSIPRSEVIKQKLIQKSKK